jgi:hypothetical protein
MIALGIQKRRETAARRVVGVIFSRIISAADVCARMALK